MVRRRSAERLADLAFKIVFSPATVPQPHTHRAQTRSDAWGRSSSVSLTVIWISLQLRGPGAKAIAENIANLKCVSRLDISDNSWVIVLISDGCRCILALILVELFAKRTFVSMKTCSLLSFQVLKWIWSGFLKNCIKTKHWNIWTWDRTRDSGKLHPEV